MSPQSTIELFNPKKQNVRTSDTENNGVYYDSTHICWMDAGSTRCRSLSANGIPSKYLAANKHKTTSDIESTDLIYRFIILQNFEGGELRECCGCDRDWDSWSKSRRS